MKLEFFIFFLGAVVSRGRAFILTTRNFRSLRSSSSVLEATAKVLTNERIHIALTNIRGDADRAFRTGMVLEQRGQARAASFAFHESATLFKCSIDSRNEFQYVSSVNRRELPSLLAYSCVRLAHLSHDALGDAEAAVRLYRDAILIGNSGLSYDGIGTSIEASNGNLKDAAAAYHKALASLPDDIPRRLPIVFHLAVALERLGEEKKSEELMNVLRKCELRYSCLVDSWGYVRWHTRKMVNSNLHRGTYDMLQIALDAASPMLENGNSFICEFGVAAGRSLRITQELLPLFAQIHGFDTFTGLPQRWGDEPAGAYSTGGRSPVMDGGNVYFHTGLFRDTIPNFLQMINKDAVLAYANIDCDLYTSTLDVLECLNERIVPGSVLVFDKYLCHPTWRHDEFRAFQECCKRYGWNYEYLAFSLSTKQAVVRITGKSGLVFT